ncbi:MAG: hypothetical protein ACRYGK_14815 [Janthinobacterium lividum]
MDMANRPARVTAPGTADTYNYQPDSLAEKVALFALDDLLMPIACNGSQEQKFAALEAIWVGPLAGHGASQFATRYPHMREDILPGWETARGKTLHRQIDRHACDVLISSLNLPSYLEQQYHDIAASAVPGESTAGKMHAWLRQVRQGMVFLEQNPVLNTISTYQNLSTLWQDEMPVRNRAGSGDLFFTRFAKARRNARLGDAAMSAVPMLTSRDFGEGVKRALVSQLPRTFQQAYDKIHQRSDLSNSARQDRILRLIGEHAFECLFHEDVELTGKQNDPAPKSSVPVVQTRAAQSSNGFALLVSGIKRKAALLGAAHKSATAQPPVSVMEQEFTRHFASVMKFVDTPIKVRSQMPADMQAACAWFANADGNAQRGWALSHEPLSGYADQAIAQAIDDAAMSRSQMMALRTRLLAAEAHFGRGHNISVLASRYVAALDHIARPD